VCYLWKVTKKRPLPTVTFPVLIATTRDEAEGWCSNGSGFFAVRAPTLRDLYAAKSTLKPEDVAFLDGITALRRAYSTHEGAALESAVQQLQPFRPQLPGLRVEDWSGPNKWESARWLYSELLTTALRKAQLVLWWPEGRARLIVPAVFCPDLRTASVCAVFRDALSVCPKCKLPFIPSKPGMRYCTPAHGVAHRTAKSRKKKARETKKAV
jgi:hypothetical protein